MASARVLLLHPYQEGVMRKSTTIIMMCVLGVASSPTFAAERVKLSGYAEWRFGDTLIVEGQRVRASERTLFVGKSRARDIRSIGLGDEVKVDGYRSRDGSVLARKIESRPNGSAMFEGQLSSEFDAIESQWVRRGYVYEPGASGNDVRLGRLVQRGPEVARVRNIINSLVPPSRQTSDFRAYVIDNETWNAMAAPNGSVFVFTGLLDAMDDDELAIIVGHELVHATHEHSRRQYKRGLWTQLGLAGILAAASSSETACDNNGNLRESLVETGAIVGVLAFQNRFSRHHEDQADRVGLRYAHEAGYDVSKAPELWRRFGAKYASQPDAVNFLFGSHSSPKARSRNLEREIRLNYR
jgi:Zn-dependent protease with chaperone function